MGLAGAPTVSAHTRDCSRRSRAGSPDKPHQPAGGSPFASVRVEPVRVTGGAEAARENRRGWNTGRLQLIPIRRPQIQLQPLTVPEPAAEIAWVMSSHAKRFYEFCAHGVTARPDAGPEGRNQVSRITAVQLSHSGHGSSRDPCCGAAPSRMYGGYGAPAAVRNQQRRAVGDTHGEHQRRITTDQAVGSRPRVPLNGLRIDHCCSVNLVNRSERATWDATAGRKLMPLRFAIGRPRNDCELPGRPPVNRDSGERHALHQCAPGLLGPREGVRKLGRGESRTGHRFRDSKYIVE